MTNRLLMKAWKERWSPEKLSVHIRSSLSASEISQLPGAVLKQATIGSSANAMLLSYLQHMLSSQVVTFTEVARAIAALDEILKPACIFSLMELLKVNVTMPRAPHRCGDNSLEYAKALSELVVWLLGMARHAVNRVSELSAATTTPVPQQTSALTGPTAVALWMGIVGEACSIGEAILQRSEHVILIRLQSVLGETSTSTVPCHKVHEASAALNSTVGLLSPASDAIVVKVQGLVSACHKLQSNDECITNDVCLRADSGLAVGILVCIEAQVNTCADVHKFVVKLQLVAALQRMSPSELFCELMRACLIGIVESVDADQKIWVSFTFLKLPSIILELVRTGGADATTQLELGVHHLQTYSTLLCAFESALGGSEVWHELLSAMAKRGLLSEETVKDSAARRAQQRATSLRLPSTESHLCGLILRADMSIDTIIKHLSAASEMELARKGGHYAEVMHQITMGQNIEIYTLAACCSGRLTSFVTALLRFNELSFQPPTTTMGAAAADDVRTHLFDLTFLMLCHITLLHGPELFMSGGPLAEHGGGFFFVQWARSALLGGCDSSSIAETSRVDAIAARLASRGSLRGLTLRDLCVCGQVAVEQLLTLVAASSEQRGAAAAAAAQEDLFKAVATNMRAASAALPVIIAGAICSRATVFTPGHRAAAAMLLTSFLEPIGDSGVATAPVVQTKMDLMLTIVREIVRKYRFVKELNLSLQQQQQLQDPVVTCLLGDPLAVTLSKTLEKVYEKGRLDDVSARTLRQLRRVSSPEWFSQQLTNVLFPKNAGPYVEDAAKAVAILFGLTHIDLEMLTYAMSVYTIPVMLQKCVKPFALTEPKCQALAQYCVWCLLALLTYGQSPEGYGHDIGDILMELQDVSGLGSLPAIENEYLQRAAPSVTDRVVAHVLNIFWLVSKGGMINQRTHFVTAFMQMCASVGRPHCTNILKRIPLELAAAVLEDCGSEFLSAYVESQLPDITASNDPGRALTLLADLCCSSLNFCAKTGGGVPSSAKIEQ